MYAFRKLRALIMPFKGHLKFKEKQIPLIYDYLEIVRQHVIGKEILHIGACETGAVGTFIDIPSTRFWFHSFLTEEGKRVTGLDNDLIAVNNMQKSGYDVKHRNILSPIRDLGTFDVVIANHVLNHIGDISSLFQNIKDSINSQGILIIKVHNISAITLPYNVAKNTIWTSDIANSRHVSSHSFFSITNVLAANGFSTNYCAFIVTTPLGAAFARYSNYFADEILFIAKRIS